MQVEGIEIDRDEARKRVEEFTARRRRKLTEMDHALFRGYKALAEGLLVIDADKMIKAGGVFEANFCPKLAIARSDLKEIFYCHTLSYNEPELPTLKGAFAAWNFHEAHEAQFYKRAIAAADFQKIGLMDYARDHGLWIELENISQRETKGRMPRWFRRHYKAIVPEIPFHLRPNGDAENYFVLWEVEEWEEVYRQPRAPRDPILLERITHPIYVVVAQWDLTEMEQRILETFRRR